MEGRGFRSRPRVARRYRSTFVPKKASKRRLRRWGLRASVEPHSGQALVCLVVELKTKYRKTVTMAEIQALIEQYSRGAALLRDVIARTPADAWDAKPIPGTWSIRQVLCHLTDGEIVYADRIKRVIAEDNPTFFEADPDQFVPALFCETRDWKAEMSVIESIRSHMVPILQSCTDDDFRRGGVHSLDGPMNLLTLLSRITSHIPHHLVFIEQKLDALEG